MVDESTPWKETLLLAEQSMLSLIHILVAPGTQEKVDEAKKRIVEEGFNVFDGVLETNDGKTIGEEGKTLDDATITGGINWYYKNIVVK